MFPFPFLRMAVSGRCPVGGSHQLGRPKDSRQGPSRGPSNSRRLLEGSLQEPLYFGGIYGIYGICGIYGIYVLKYLFGALEAWNFMMFHSVGNNNPNWRTHIFQRGWNHQPVIYIYNYIYIYICSIFFSYFQGKQSTVSYFVAPNIHGFRELHISGDPAESSVQGLATEGGHRSEGAGNSSIFLGKL